ncbi:MAG: hypothetical protein C5B55_05100, partial [Blastocatellia bacterium]
MSRCVKLVFVLLVASPLAAAQSLPEWYRVYTFDDSFIDMNTSIVTPITSDVNRVRFRWTFEQMQSLGKELGSKYQSRLEVTELNCSAHQYRLYHLTFLDATGNIVRIDDTPGDWRSVVSGSMMEKLFVPGCELITTKTRRLLPSTDTSETKELERAARYAYDFVQHLERQKDFKPVIEKFFVDDYLTRYLGDNRNRWFLNLSNATAAKVTREELQRFYVAMMNAGYLSSVYLMSELNSDSEEPAKPERLLPPDVWRLVKSHPYTLRYKTREGNYDFLSEEINDAQQLRGYTDLLEKIASLMRQHIRMLDAVGLRNYKTILADVDGPT